MRYAIAAICAAILAAVTFSTWNVGYRAGYRDGFAGSDSLMTAGMKNGFGAGWYACFLASADSLYDSSAVDFAASHYGYKRSELPDPRWDRK